jgi:hypothetical protein
MRVTTNPVPITGEAEPLDPADPQPFADALGTQFVAVDGGTVLYRNMEGHVCRAYPGWIAVRPDGGGAVHVSNSANLGAGPGFFWNPA